MRVTALSRPRPGEIDNGDGFMLAVSAPDGALVESISSGQLPSGDEQRVRLDIAADTTLLVALVDGVGHGPQAAVARQAVLRCVERNWSEDLRTLAAACHHETRPSRGATMALARVHGAPRTVDFLAIGDVRAWLWHPPYSSKELVTSRGLVGYQIDARLFLQHAELPTGCCLVMTSDGITGDLTEAPSPSVGDDWTGHFIATAGVDRDDATVVLCEA